MFYERKIKYLDYHEGGEKIRGGGFVKLELKEDKLRMELTVKGLYPTDSFVRDVMLRSGGLEAALGQITIQSGSGVFRYAGDLEKEMGHTGIAYKALREIRIPIGGNRELICPLAETMRSYEGQRSVFQEEVQQALRQEETAGEGERIETPGHPESFSQSPELVQQLEERDEAQAKLLQPGGQEEDQAKLPQPEEQDELQDMLQQSGRQGKAQNMLQQSGGQGKAQDMLQQSDEQGKAQDKLLQPGAQEDYRVMQPQFEEGKDSQVGMQQFEERKDSQAEMQQSEVQNEARTELRSVDRKQDIEGVAVRTIETLRSSVHLGKPESREGNGAKKRSVGKEKNAAKLLEDKWQQLSAIYPHIQPFQDERDYLSISPSDFVLFPSKCYKAVNNSFLLHGYYNYDHLILARMEHRGEILYYIGVPGNYFDREKQVAIMFGFESFECAAEPAKTGDFGYYMMRTEL